MAMSDLPIEEIAGPLSRLFEAGNRVVITAPTGTGKSTRVPCMLLAHAGIEGRILVLEPRRLAARVLAERVAWCMGEKPGLRVGYQTRFERCGGPATRLWYITAGLLPRFLQENGDLEGVGCVVFDEFHERSVITDIGLGMVRDVQARRPDLRLVVMSATLDVAPVCEFLEGCPHLHAEGRMHPVEVRYLPKPAGPEIWEEAALATAAVMREGEGDVLVFMPGAYEIRRTLEACRRRIAKVELLALFGDLPPAAQHRVMEPGTRRRVVVATNIAETSLTVPGVRHVVDSGLARIARYDPGRGMSMLEVHPISRASADQRSGRAGREGPGQCLRLWSLAEQHRRPSVTLPEVRRVDLAEALLLLCSLGVADPTTFAWFEAPAEDACRAAADLLRDLGLVTGDGSVLTSVGREVSRIPVHPRLGRMLYEASRRGCLQQAGLAAAALTERRILLPGRRLAERDGLRSDLLALVEMLQQARDVHFDVAACGRLGIHAAAAGQTWATARHLVRAVHREEGPGAGTGREVEEGFAKSVLLAFPDRLARRRDAGTLLCELRQGRTAELARESGVRDVSLLVAAELREAGGRGRPIKSLLSLVTETREEWLFELFPEAWEERDETLWDERRRQVVRRVRLACLGVVLEDREVVPVAAALATRILAEQVLQGRLPLKGWTAAVEHWIARVRWLRGQFPGEGLPAYDEADRRRAVLALCAGAGRYRDIKDKDCLPVVRGLLGPAAIRFVERMAPESIRLPCGRGMRIEYHPERPPKGRARIQDLYDVRQTPRVAEGRVPLLLDILAPNMRTMQITDDLEAFWRDIYPRVKKEMARRYPKHEWR